MTNSMTNDARMQENIFAFLTDPARHPNVRRIDTHAASIFLEGTRALKIKRAVRFPFLDYSTLEKRKAACEQEIKINLQFAPQLYRRVVPVTRNEDGSLSIDGSGTPVEYAVEMMRFDERKTIDQLACAGSLDPGLVDAIAEAIAASHVKAARASVDSWIESIPKIIEDNRAALQAAGRFPGNDIARLGTASHAAFSRIRDLLVRRGQDGYVRRCHGDLHLANIVLIDQGPMLFDAIEFDEKIASIDVLYDLAFPLMDFLRYVRPDAANALLNRYLQVTPTQNLEAIEALPLFTSMRAAIRAHVLLARPHTSSKNFIEDAHAYFNLAEILIRPKAPMLVAIGGLSGTGKSVLARALAPSVMPQPGAVVLRSDLLRKQLFKTGERERLPTSAYRPEVNEQVYELATLRARLIVSQGHSAIIDAVFARENERTTIRDAARALNVRFVGLFLVADVRIRQSRVGQRTADASDATAEIARLQERYDIGHVDWTIIDASGTPEATLAQCLTRIGSPEIQVPGWSSTKR